MIMEDVPDSQFNPWVDDDKALGTISSVLKIAERTGHIKGLKDACIPDDDVSRRRLYSEVSSLKFITLLREISKTQKQLDKANLEIQCRFQDKETRDVTHMDTLEKRSADITKLCTHLQSIVNNKSHLIGRLQQPFVGDYLKIEATYHRYVSQVFPMLAPILAELTNQLDNIEWAKKVDIGDGQLETVLTDISSALASLQTSFQSVCQLRDSISHLHSQSMADDS
ncbi:HAUS augmin-like complex subunit 2 [Lingula anatina]|uniref:HAUS augmin-like complex subunit 2 n=1 Tax=Lingula anatina TaxID=7574 RepID=A0A1S3ILI3_LINAN|nr:HAUS augmin-like complex subunit 2 [Lingula anatina]|eukprot:XP_013398379.1 HAUS augmin-like complex subunit 2 [Lingula anatina]